MRIIIKLLLFIICINAYSQKEYYVITKDSVKLFVQEFGKGDTIMILAGGPGMDKNYMKPLYDSLSKMFYCVTYDQRGTGKSFIKNIDTSSLDIEKLADDIESIRIHLSNNKISLIGHSWGGMLAMDYVSRYPYRVENLILLNSGGPTSNFVNYYVDNIYLGLIKCDYTKGKKLDNIDFNSFKEILPGYFYNCNKAIELIKSDDFEQMFYFDRKINEIVFNNYFKTQNERVEKLKLYKGHVSIILGDVDPISEKTANEIKEILSQANIYIIKNCGHFPWFEGTEQDKQLNLLIRKCR